MVIDTSALIAIDQGSSDPALIHRRHNGAEPRSKPKARTTSGVD